jgi:rod shape-determining protein MreD
MTLVPTTSRRLDPWRWLGLPSLICIAATMLFSAPVRLFGLALPEPVFPLTLAFAWAVIRPSMLAPFVVLLVGLFLDLWWGAAVGFWAICLLVAYGVTLSVRRVLSGQGWLGLAGWYAVATLSAMATGMLLTGMMTAAPPNVLAVVWQTLACLVLFPFAHRLIERFEDADVRFR